MFGLYKFQFPFFSPDDNTSSTSQPLSVDGILDVLNEETDNKDEELDLTDKKDDSKKSDKKDKPTKEDDKITETEDDKKDDKKDEDEEDELDELETELDKEDEDDEELELITPVKRKEILAVYPDLFKKFPYLEKAYYREQKFSEIFPSLEDARVAQENAQVLKEFETTILKGDISGVITELKKENQDSFHKLVDNYLPTLQKIDERAFFHVVNSILKPVIYKMAKAGMDENNDDLKTGARVLNQFMYGSTKWEPHKPLSAETQTNPEENREREEIKKEKEALFNERYNTAKTDLQTRVETTFKKAIDKYIDPKNEMGEYVKKSATREALETLGKTLSGDNRYRALLDKAWRRAGEKNFDKDSMDNIRRIINARAQTVLPTVIKKARIEALRGIGKRVRNTDKDDDNTSDKGRSTSSNNRGPLRERGSRDRQDNNNKGGIPQGMSSKDFIMSDS